MNNETQLITVVKETGLSQEGKVQELMQSFTGYFDEARKLSDGASDIVVTDVSQVELMKEARERRLKLKNIRTEVEKTRKTLKEQSLREGKAIDGVANVIKALIVPLEEHLERQEQYAETIKAERRAKLLAEREEKLSKYVSDVRLYNLDGMEDEVFSNLLSGCKANWEKAHEEEEKAEKERIESEKKEKVFNDRRIELAPYNEFIEETINLNTTEDEYLKILKAGKKAKAEYDAEQEQIRKENEKLRKQREEAELKMRQAEQKAKLEREIQEKKEREAKEKAEAEVRAKEDAERQALLAPDKEKLLVFAMEIQRIKAPAVKTKEADYLIESANNKILEAVMILQEGAKKL